MDTLFDNNYGSKENSFIQEIDAENTLLQNVDNISDDNDEISVKITKKRMQQFSDSDDEHTFKNAESHNHQKNYSNDKNGELHSLKIKTNRNRQNIFNTSTENAENIDEKNILSNTSDSDGSESESEKLQQNFKRTSSPRVCGQNPDFEENDIGKIKKIYQDKAKSKKRTTKLISSEPMKSNQKMSAKQAMENMQKIKSESNRMLREKDISLPYHHPKALSLKDIMSRRKPALTTDGKVLPLKMNDEQLKHYVSLLEQRQKEIIELCKSESEEEENEPQINKTHIDCEKNLETNIIEDNIGYITSTSVDTHDIESNAENIKDDLEIQNIIKTSTVPDTIIYNNEFINRTNDIKDSNVDNNSQIQGLYYDSEKVEDPSEILNKCNEKDDPFINKQNTEDKQITYVRNEDVEKDNELELVFSDDDIDMEDIDLMIENAEVEPIITAPSDSECLKPKLTGAPGMLIDLETNETIDRKLSGVELLKERFKYFAKIKTSDELEREKEKRIKPGTQHIKLKQELEDKIAEQKSIVWAKRLEEEKQKQLEIKEFEGDMSDNEDELEKIEAKLAEESDHCEKGNGANSESDDEEEELPEDDIDMNDKSHKKRNPLIADEAEESELDEGVDEDGEIEKGGGENEKEESNDDSSEISEDSSDSDDEQEDLSKNKKGRILKAFEDSDEEEAPCFIEDVNKSKKMNIDQLPKKNSFQSIDGLNLSQDDELPSAQLHQTFSEDMFPSQQSGSGESDNTEKNNKDTLMHSTHHVLDCNETLPASEENISDGKNLNKDGILQLNNSQNLSIICESQIYDDAKFDDIVGMCSGSFSQNLVTSQTLKAKVGEMQSSQDSQSIGENILDMCTGKFYDNDFISTEPPKLESTPSEDIVTDQNDQTTKDNLLQSILEELDGPDLNKSKSKYFCSTMDNNQEKEVGPVNAQLKKRFVIESDDEEDKTDSIKKNKKRKKKKVEKRALQISDDEQESDEEKADDEMESEIEDTERLVEYDSEENEVEVVKPQNGKRKGRDFFEQEAELTSEDEWMGSGDEDEADLDRMEREDGDDDKFNQGQLQRELGQIHMREVLDQDKREVRLLQELLFEDGDLGDGHRQRKFRWKNADGEEEQGPLPEELADTQEDEFESEEQWRKQRHERETFLRQMMKESEDKDSNNVNINRTTIIKANLNSKTMSNLLLEVSKSEEKTDTETKTVIEKKQSAKDLPSPAKKPFVIQQQWQGSLLSRGHGSLARLAALATPLAVDGDEVSRNSSTLAPKNRRNLVFAALSPSQNEQIKVAKRKADVNVTPNLIKKLRTDGTEKPQYRRSLLDHMQI